MFLRGTVFYTGRKERPQSWRYSLGRVKFPQAPEGSQDHGQGLSFGVWNSSVRGWILAGWTVAGRRGWPLPPEASGHLEPVPWHRNRRDRGWPSDRLQADCDARPGGPQSPLPLLRRSSVGPGRDRGLLHPPADFHLHIRRPPAIRTTYSTVWGGVELIGRKVDIQPTEHPLTGWQREQKQAAQKRAMIRKIEAVTAEELLPYLNAERQKAGGYKARRELMEVFHYVTGALVPAYNEVIEKQVAKLQPEVAKLLQMRAEAERVEARADRIDLARSREAQLRTTLAQFAEHPYRMTDVEMIQIIEDMLETGRPPSWLDEVYDTRARDIAAALKRALE